jgi:hypothetical protein
MHCSKDNELRHAKRQRCWSPFFAAVVGVGVGDFAKPARDHFPCTNLHTHRGTWYSIYHMFQGDNDTTRLHARVRRDRYCPAQCRIRQFYHDYGPGRRSVPVDCVILLRWVYLSIEEFRSTIYHTTFWDHPHGSK